MRRYAQYDENGRLTAIGTGVGGGVEITEAEYNAILAEIREKVVLVDKLYNEEVTIEDIKKEWQEEIQRRVNERIEFEGTLEEQPISSEEFMCMLEEVL